MTNNNAQKGSTSITGAMGEVMGEEHLDKEMDEDMDDEFETIGEHHRMAAHHFAAAARHHEAAAAAADDSNDGLNAHEAYLAYRHQLNAVQYAEIAVMDNESFEGDAEPEPA